MDTIEHKGLTFRVDVKPDDSADYPWQSCDGHGPVLPARRGGGLNTGERPLGGRHVYDFNGALAIAKRDQWGLGPDESAALARVLGHEPTADEVTEAAVEADFRNLQRYCDGDWFYVGVVVTLLDVDGEPTDLQDSLWGIESDAYAYHKEVARELAEEIAKPLGRRKTLTRVTRIRS